jgi:hypothetical protein
MRMYAPMSPPINPSCAHFITTSAPTLLIASGFEDINAAIVEWSGSIPRASAFTTIISRHAFSCRREPMTPFE